MIRGNHLKKKIFTCLDIEDNTDADYPHAKRVFEHFEKKKYREVSWFVCSKGYINVSWCIWELLKYVLKYMYNQLQKLLPRSLQKICNYKQLLKTAPDQSMLRVRLWKLMQHWLEKQRLRGSKANQHLNKNLTKIFCNWLSEKIGNVLYILSLRWYFESSEIATAAYCRSCHFHKTIFLNWLTFYKRKVK